MAQDNERYNLEAIQRLIDDEKYPEAISQLNSVLDAEPDNLTALFQFGDVMLKVDNTGLALNIYRYLLSKAPNRPEIWNNIGRCLQSRDSSEEARKHFKKALELEPMSYHAMINMAVMDVNDGKPHSAIRYATEALRLDPSSRQAHDSLAMAKLQLKDWSGWDHFRASEGPPFRPLRQYVIDPPEREWEGNPGQTVVVYGEQGLGDEILYSSCIPDAARVSRKIIMDVDNRLQGLFTRSFPGVDVYGTRHDKNADSWAGKYLIDASAPIGRLPGFYRRKDSDFTGKPWLKACPLRKKAFRAMLDSLGSGLKIGLAWNGGKRNNSTNKADSDYRSFRLEQWKDLIHPDHVYVSLEYKPSRDAIAESGLPVHEFPWITQSQDYDDTAALVDELDFIIAVPTTVVHLAGALGKQCFCISPQHPDWRFHAGQEKLWHESVNLFRDDGRHKHVKELNRYLYEIGYYRSSGAGARTGS